MIMPNCIIKINYLKKNDNLSLKSKPLYMLIIYISHAFDSLLQYQLSIL